MNKGRPVPDDFGAGVDRDTIVKAGLVVLDRAGFAGCTVDAVAERLGVAPADVARHFPSRDQMLTAIGHELLRAVPSESPPESWRECLAERAMTGRQAMLSHHDGTRLFGHLASGSPLDTGRYDCVPLLCASGFSVTEARTAIMAVDHFTIGSALVEQWRDGDEPQGGFEQQLDIVLAGVAAALPAPEQAPADERHSRFQSRLWAFLRDARESANISFARTARVNELDRRILLLLQAQGGMTLASISMACGVDKAQVSRAIKRMSEVGLLVRSGIRSPIRLSPGGKQLAERLLRQAELRNRELTFAISDDELQTLSTVLDTLLGRAITLFEQERKQATTNQRQEQVDFQDLVDEGLPGENGVAVVRSRVLPPFVTLCSYILRGGALAHKRQTSLSNFESWVMAEICRNPPISWPQLVLALSRDQSQAGRTVNHLIEIGLVERTGRLGRRHGFFAPTEKGRRISDIINDTAARRSEFLFQGIPASELDSFMGTFDVLARNAEVQLARERAIQEMDRGTEP